MAEKLDPRTLVRILNTYRVEGRDARSGGSSARDDVWAANVEIYWNRYDFTGKAPWQFQQRMPEAPQIVDRWAAAMRDALQNAGQWFAIDVPGDVQRGLGEALEKFLTFFLKKCGTSVTGDPAPFEIVFEEQAKLAAMMAGTAAVAWDKTTKRATVEVFDPRELHLDPTGRGLYRVRRREMDLYKIEEKAESGLFDREAVDRLTATMRDELEREKERLRGSGEQEGLVARKPIVVDEFYCTILDDVGAATEKDVLCVVANEQELVRGPEKNPFKHGRDWVVYAPMITVPLSVYGKSYMENWAPLALAFNDMTNLIMDGVYLSSMKMFACDPTTLQDPNQLNEGARPNKMWMIEGGTTSAANFMASIEMGRLPQEAITVWQSLKAELREGSNMNDVGLGQLPKSGETSATAVTEAQANSGALVRSIAKTIEDRLIAPTIRLVFYTAMQYFDPQDPDLRAAVGESYIDAIAAQRNDFIEKPMSFNVNGITTFIQRSEALRSLLAFLGAISRNDALLQEFMKRFDVGKLLERLMKLSNVDANDFELSPVEQQVRSVIQSSIAGSGAGGAGASPPNPLQGGGGLGGGGAGPLAGSGGLPLPGSAAQGAPGNPAAMMREVGGLMGGG